MEVTISGVMQPAVAKMEIKPSWRWFTRLPALLSLPIGVPHTHTHTHTHACARAPAVASFQLGLGAAGGQLPAGIAAVYIVYFAVLPGFFLL